MTTSHPTLTTHSLCHTPHSHPESTVCSWSGARATDIPLVHSPKQLQCTILKAKWCCDASRHMIIALIVDYQVETQASKSSVMKLLRSSINYHALTIYKPYGTRINSGHWENREFWLKLNINKLQITYVNIRVRLHRKGHTEILSSSLIANEKNDTNCWW